VLKEADEKDEAVAIPEVRFTIVNAQTMADFISFRQRHATFSRCSCMKWRMRSREFGESGRSDRTSLFDAMVAGGVPVGILASVDDDPIAWCSVAPRETFPALQGRASRSATGEEHVWAVTCFFVDYRYRRQGMTLRLLRAAVEYARAAGAKVVEGYPWAKSQTSGICAGTESTFRGAGFRRFAKGKSGRVIMRNVVG
jgi:GNAT superfamily N-acetyltransferase